MNNKIKSILFIVTILFALLVLPNISNAATEVTDEESLLSAISSSESVILKNDITVTKPIVIQKEITIDGNGHSVVGSEDWTSTSGNQTMFTAQFSEGKLTLKNITLKNGPKYGVQSYDGATVILNDVSITGFKYGGVLANGGNVEVIDLHLGYNGTDSNNGIEIDKGASATNNPTLIMNGTLTSDVNENVVRAAENGHLTEFTITNTENTTNKVVIAGGNIVLTDENNNVISESAVPEKATPNVDEKSAVVTLITGSKTNKIVVTVGETITEELLKSHIELEENYVIDGFYTEAEYINKFDFSTKIEKDITIYAKISEVEIENGNEDEENSVTEEVEEKDETPKTGIESYLGLALITITISAIFIILSRKKSIKE